MKSYLECIPCFIRQTLDSVQRVSDDEAIQEEVLRYVLWIANRMDMNDSPPFMGQLIHRMIRQKTHIADPYAEIKKEFNQLILSMIPDLNARIENSADPLETAARLAIAGNVIDYGANSHIDALDIECAVDEAMQAPLDWDREDFTDALQRANTILYLADNAGEIVFDRLWIERLPMEKITVAVRGFPVLNDVTLDDAREVGLSNIVNVIENGSDAPGTILSDCSERFLEQFERADIVIAKGQGNYETLSETDKDIYFVLKAKCPVIARHIGCRVGDMVFKNEKSMKRESTPIEQTVT